MPSPITADCLLDVAGLQHGFFTRQGGVSEGIYAGLNCGLGSRDQREHVVENRRRVAAHLGARPSALLTCHQVHSAEAVVVAQVWEAGASPKADALVTNVPGLALGALAADCAPVLFADPAARVIAAAHAGWKGALTGILESTIGAMVSLGARASRIGAVLGPCIGLDAYEVGPEFKARFVEADPDNSRHFKVLTEGGRAHFDLPGYVLDRLAKAGLDTVETVSACTFTDEQRFFSYRRSVKRGEGDYGRQISALVLL